MHHHRQKDFLMGAVVGSTLGALTAMMFTKKGHKWQKEIMHKYHEWEGDLKKYAAKAEKKVKKAIRKKVR